jgi:glycosyltransferase involved in cell wall biosynthesis
MILEKERPDITFEVVESRGNWNHLVYKVQDQYGEERRVLTNVNITPNTNNMAAVYSRTKILLAPSLWWEAYGRVISEATINKIPAVVTNRGGLPEAAGPTGLIIELPQELYKAPYNRLPSAGKIREFIDTIIKLEDDSVTYKNIVDTINASHPEQKLSESQAALHDYLISTTERQNLIQRR